MTVTLTNVPSYKSKIVDALSTRINELRDEYKNIKEDIKEYQKILDGVNDDTIMVLQQVPYGAKYVRNLDIGLDLNIQKD